MTKQDYVVVVEIKVDFAHGDSMGQRMTYLTGYCGEAHGPSEAAAEVIDGLSLGAAKRIVRVRAMPVADIPEVTYPKVEVRW